MIHMYKSRYVRRMKHNYCNHTKRKKKNACNYGILNAVQEHWNDWTINSSSPAIPNRNKTDDLSAALRWAQKWIHAPEMKNPISVGEIEDINRILLSSQTSSISEIIIIPVLECYCSFLIWVDKENFQLHLIVILFSSNSYSFFSTLTSSHLTHPLHYLSICPISTHTK